MTEQAMVIGDTPRLVGVYSKANMIEDAQTLPTILMINSGLLNRVGPFRHYVRLARSFSDLGFNVLRFDLSGIGDSEQRYDNQPFERHAMDDIKEVMEYLRAEKKATQFIIFGICTGADNAHRSMLEQNNIVGAIMIDGYCYPTIQYRFNLYSKKLFRWSSWRTFARLTYKNVTSLFETPKKEEVFESFNFEWVLPKREKVESDYQVFIDRNIFLLNIFTASWPYNYDDQLSDSLPNVEFGENISAIYLKNAEHTFPLREDQNLLSKTIINWLARCYNL